VTAPQSQQLEKVFAGSATNHVPGYMAVKELPAPMQCPMLSCSLSSNETLGLVPAGGHGGGLPGGGRNRGGHPGLVTDWGQRCLYDPDEPPASLASATARCWPARSVARNWRLGRPASEAERWGWAARHRQLRGLYRQVSQAELAMVADRDAREMYNWLLSGARRDANFATGEHGVDSHQVLSYIEAGSDL